jgi:hypothetical protein
MLTAIGMSVNAVKGKAALHLSRTLGVQYKTAWVLSLKNKEALGLRRVGMELYGEVQIDGKYAGGHTKQKSKAEDRIDRRLKAHQNMKRMCVLALREKNGSGFERTFPRIVREKQGGKASRPAWPMAGSPRLRQSSVPHCPSGRSRPSGRCARCAR